VAELRHGKVCCERGPFAFLPTMPTPENMEDYVGERASRASARKKSGIAWRYRHL
jgi:hypothetical protein